MKKRMSCALLALACLPLSGLAQTYIGFGAGKADYSDFTLRDMEWDSLNVTQQKTNPPLSASTSVNDSTTTWLLNWVT